LTCNERRNIRFGKLSFVGYIHADRKLRGGRCAHVVQLLFTRQRDLITSQSPPDPHTAPENTTCENDNCAEDICYNGVDFTRLLSIKSCYYLNFNAHIIVRAN